MPRKDAQGGSISAQAQQDLVSEGIENFELPKSLVMKIAKSSIPENVKLQKETVLSLVKGSTVFINYLAANAHDVAQSRQHKSISASDVLRALEIMQFGDMANKLQYELAAYREITKHNESAKSGKKSANGSTPTGSKKAGSTSVAGGAVSLASAPVSTKNKGKEKAVASNPLPSPFTSAPLPLSSEATQVGELNVASTAEENENEAMDVDEWPAGQPLEAEGQKEGEETPKMECLPT